MHRFRILQVFTALVVTVGLPIVVSAQAPEPSRRGVIEQEQAEKVKNLRPHQLTLGERVMNKFEDITVNGGLHWHPFFDSGYRGGGFTLGAGYMHHVSAYNLLDVRGSYTVKGYTRAEVEFKAPRIFQRRGTLSVLGGIREATQVGFYGIGTDTSKDARTNYTLTVPYGSAIMTLWPTRKLLMLRGGVDMTEWSQKPGEGSFPSVETVYDPATLVGLGSKVRYLHTQGTVGLDTRLASDYARRGGFYGITLHDYTDNDDTFGFQQVDYEVVQHVPILREAWVISLRGLVQTTHRKDDQEIPFFMLPSLGGGTNLRGYSSWRFRDRDSLLLQGEWRIMVNRYIDTAFFYDAGKVVAREADLDFTGLKHDYGFGVRFHSPIETPLRIDLARSNEGLSLVFTTSAAF